VLDVEVLDVAELVLDVLAVLEVLGVLVVVAAVVVPPPATGGFGGSRWNIPERDVIPLTPAPTAKPSVGDVR
jgi:hypothetical protein